MATDKNLRRKKRLEELRAQLSVFEQELREYVMDDCDDAEEEVARCGGRFDDYAEQDDGTSVGIVYSENASPALDAAVSNLFEAWLNISDELAELRYE